MSDMEAFQVWVKRPKTNPILVNSPVPLYHTARLCGEAGEVADIVAKQQTINYALNPALYREKLLLELGDTMHYIAHLLNGIDATFEEAAAANIEKLTNREKHGKGNFGIRS